MFSQLDRDRLDLPMFDQLAMRLGVRSLHDFQKRSLLATIGKRDTFLTVPTGGGKSFCYLLPALVSSGLVLVVSPLVALMRDQQKALEDLDIPSATYDSLLSQEDRWFVREKIAQQKLKVLFVSPERLAVPSFRELLAGLPMALIAIDEAHCVHHWGHGFRPEYRRLGFYLDSLPYAPRMALTATVTKKEREEIITSLRMEEPVVLAKFNPRENLVLKVMQYKKAEDRMQTLVARVSETEGQGIIYAPTRRIADELYVQLKTAGHSVGLYHGGLDSIDRNSAQFEFSIGKARTLIATKAFGMGLNIPGIRFVFHAGMPCSIESYVQEIGRAGRDGEPSVCELHYGPRDYFLQKFMIEKSYPEDSVFEAIVSAAYSMLERSDSILLSELTTNLKEAGFMLGEEVSQVLGFLYQENLLQQEAIVDQFSGKVMPSWHLSAERVELSEILERKREQVKWRLEKLRAMLNLIKAGESHIPAFIEGYFQ